MIIYNADTETTGLSYLNNDVIELSLIRSTDEAQRTWFMKAINIEAIQLVALKINGHKYDDITWKTAEGKAKYLDPNKAIVEIENWIMEDNVPPEDRVLVGHNIGFDKTMLEILWQKCGASDSFPFGRRVIDTMQIEIINDICCNDLTSLKGENYSQNACIKKYGIKNEKAHSAAADVAANRALFLKQIENQKKKLSGK